MNMPPVVSASSILSFPSEDKIKEFSSNEQHQLVEKEPESTMVTPPAVSASSILHFPSEVKIEESSSENQKDHVAVEETGSNVRNTRYSLRLKAAAVAKKVEDAAQIPSQYTESLGTDSGFETGSDLSVTPAFPPQTASHAPQLDLDHPDHSDPLDSEEDTLRDTQNTQNSSSNNKKVRSKQTKHAQTNLISNSLLCKCAICDNNNGDLIGCGGHCFQSFHLDCLGIINTPGTGFVCDECILTPTVCFKCKKVASEDGDELVACGQQHCDKHYHLSCVRSIKTFTISKETNLSSCGLHLCAKCTYTETSLNTTKLLQCIRCPLALHKVTCLVAGCEVLNDKQMNLLPTP